MEIIYEEILDSKKNDAIIRMSTNMKSGKNAKGTLSDMKWKFNKIILPVLSELGIKHPHTFSDTYEQVSMCRMKYTINTMLNNATAKVIGTQLQRRLQDDIELKKITIGLSEGRTAIILWI